MAKPAYTQTLEKGKHLNGSNFPAFVDTWNYTVKRVENLKGDRDTNPENGHITVDSSDPEHPIIRFHQKKTDGGSAEAGVIEITGTTLGSETVAGSIEIGGQEGSGILVSTFGDKDAGSVTLDVSGREEEDEFASREIEVNGEVVAKVFGSTDFEIKQKTISAGTGITVSETEDIITISTTGGSSTAGFTGERNVVVDVDYNGHYLRKKFAKETWQNGLLKSSETGEWETYHTAVEETV